MHASSRPLLIIAAGRPVKELRRHGGFDRWIRVAAGLRRDEVEVADVESGDPLPPHGRFCGAIISGSAAMVTDRLDWSERTAAWLNEAAHAGFPLMGICYGHQLLAHALGGEAGDNPDGRCMGTIEVELHAAASQDRLFAGLPKRFAAHATHVQIAQRLPDEAVALAQATHDPFHAFRWREYTWGVQFHPEFSAGHMRGYIKARADALRAEGQDSDALLRAVRPAPVARRVLRRFARLARTLTTSPGTDGAD